MFYSNYYINNVEAILRNKMMWDCFFQKLDSTWGFLFTCFLYFGVNYFSD